MKKGIINMNMNELIESINSILESDKYKNYKFRCFVEINSEEGIEFSIKSSFLRFLRTRRAYSIGRATECELEEMLEWTLDDIIENDIDKKYGQFWSNLLYDIDVYEVISDIFHIDHEKEQISLFPKGASDDNSYINLKLSINDSSYMLFKIFESDLDNVQSEGELRNAVIKKYFESLKDIKF